MKHVFEEYGKLLLAAVSGGMMLVLLYGFFLGPTGGMTAEIRQWTQAFL